VHSVAGLRCLLFEKKGKKRGEKKKEKQNCKVYFIQKLAIWALLIVAKAGVLYHRPTPL